MGGAIRRRQVGGPYNDFDQLIDEYMLADRLQSVPVERRVRLLERALERAVRLERARPAVGGASSALPGAAAGRSRDPWELRPERGPADE